MTFFFFMGWEEGLICWGMDIYWWANDCYLTERLFHFVWKLLFSSRPSFFPFLNHCGPSMLTQKVGYSIGFCPYSCVNQNGVPKIRNILTWNYRMFCYCLECFLENKINLTSYGSYWSILSTILESQKGKKWM